MNAVKEAQHSATVSAVRTAKAQKFEAELLEKLVVEEVVVKDTKAIEQRQETPAAVLPFWCSLCESRLTSYNALRCHRYTKHGVKAKARRYLSSGQCPVCMLHLDTRTRAINHMANS